MRTAPSKKRGSTLIEVLVASAVVALLMVGILQMFSLSLLMDYGSAGRTEMTFKAQQVVEVIRWVTFLRTNSPPGPSETTTGIPAVPTNGQVVNLPWDATGANYAFWGPAGVNAVEGEKLPYQISYSYTSGTASTTTTPVWIITVTATPKPVTASSVPTRLYLGSGSKNKRVDYVAQIPR